ncbi:hypothetical protein [Salinibacterium sp. TMP30]|uniref:hypothetical protein n=1 Tax=Salinibacterium sp. TMP30 TaxID=3138237 RepID=UPI0031392003
MTGVSEYVTANLANSDVRAGVHAKFPDYAIERFVADPRFLSDVVRFDVPLRGDISGMRRIHSQCHIGTDTISLERLGVPMTGLDFASMTLAEARSLAGHRPVGRNRSQIPSCRRKSFHQ